MDREAKLRRNELGRLQRRAAAIGRDLDELQRMAAPLAGGINGLLDELEAEQRALVEKEPPAPPPTAKKAPAGSFYLDPDKFRSVFNAWHYAKCIGQRCSTMESTEIGDLGMSIGLDPQDWAHVVAGRKPLATLKLVRLARTLGVEPGGLL